MSTIAVIGGYGMKGNEVRNPYTLEARSRWFKENLPFPVQEYEERVRRIQRMASNAGLDGVIVHGDGNENGFIRWVSNFSPLYGSTFIIIPTDGEIAMVADSVLHGEPMHSHWWLTWIPDVRPAKHYLEGLTDGVLSVLREKHLESEKTKLGWVGDYGFPIDTMKKILPGVDLQNYNESFLELKSIKSEREVKIMRKAMKITSDAMGAGCDAARAGLTESKIGGIINGTLISEGGHDYAFSTYVVSGPKSALKHAFPTSRRMKKGDMVYIDMGANYYGYEADMSRTFTIGKPNPKQKEILDLAYDIHKETVKMMKPGAICGEIAEKAYELAREAGFEKDTYVGGHGLGTTLFDLPVILPSVKTRLAPNMIFAYEPMIIPMKIGTAVVEDDYLVTDSGVERLTKYEQRPWL
ncbi:MAG: M24 family metallopeptidase [Nitrososphaerales archaeon]